MDSYQDQQNIGPALDPYCMTLWKCSQKIFFKKLILGKSSKKMTKKAWHFAQHADLNLDLCWKNIVDPGSQLI